MVVANAIIAGVTKAGTTSLFQYLHAHPDVCPSRTKETLFFKDHSTPDRAQAAAAEYAQFWRHHQGEACVLEASPGYLYFGGQTVQAIQAVCGRPKIVIILREPVSRTLSYFRFAKSMLWIDQDLSLADYVTACLERDHLPEADAEPFDAVRRSRYADYLQPWIDGFGSDLLICFYDQLTNTPQALLQRICQHFNIAEPSDDLTQVPMQNKTRNVRSPTLQRVALRVNAHLSEPLRSFPRAKAALAASYYWINGNEDPSTFRDPEVEAQLAAHFQPHNARLAEQLRGQGYDLDAVPWLTYPGPTPTG